MSISATGDAVELAVEKKEMEDLITKSDAESKGSSGLINWFFIYVY